MNELSFSSFVPSHFRILFICVLYSIFFSVFTSSILSCHVYITFGHFCRKFSEKSSEKFLQFVRQIVHCHDLRILFLHFYIYILIIVCFDILPICNYICIRSYLYYFRAIIPNCNYIKMLFFLETFIYFKKQRFDRKRFIFFYLIFFLEFCHFDIIAANI